MLAKAASRIKKNAANHEGDKTNAVRVVQYEPDRPDKIPDNFPVEISVV